LKERRRMGIMDWMTGLMMGKMSKDEKESMMNNAMNKMMGDMSTEEKQRMMMEMMPKMMEGINMLDMMPRMMLTMMPRMFDEIRGILAEQGKELKVKELLPKIMAPMMSTMLGGIESEKMVQHKEEMMERVFPMLDLGQKIPQRQMEMQPGCIKRLMKNILYEDRIAYTEKILGIMVEEGASGMIEEQTEEYRSKLQKIIDSGF
jgi:hypothetical protein